MAIISSFFFFLTFMVGEFCDAGDVLLSNVCVCMFRVIRRLYYVLWCQDRQQDVVSKKAQTPKKKKERKATTRWGVSCIMRFLSSDFSS